MKPLIEAGHIFIAVAPLYKVKKGKKEFYLDTDDDLERWITEEAHVSLELVVVENGKEKTPSKGAKLKEILDAVRLVESLQRRLLRKKVSWEKILDFIGKGKIPLYALDLEGGERIYF